MSSSTNGVAAQMIELIMRPGVDPRTAPNKPPLPPLEYDQRIEHGVRIERNVAVALRDGVRIYVDIYRPPGVEGERDLPILLGWSPYGKHALTNRVFWPASGVDPQWLSPLTAFEAADPVFWCPRGYAVVFADPRGHQKTGSGASKAVRGESHCGSTPDAGQNTRLVNECFPYGLHPSRIGRSRSPSTPGGR